MTRLCSICKRRPVDPAFRPFCSKRCADVDLQRWLTGGYAIPAEDQSDSDAPAAPPDEEE
jgi:hypothetical protein